MNVRQPNKEAAARLKQARSLTELPRTIFAKKHKLSANSLAAWENGTSAFSEEVAENLVSILSKEGIKVTSEWIISGKGAGPIDLGLASLQNSNFLPLSISDEEEFIWRATASFKEFYKDSLMLVIFDDSALPFYKPGDHVAGKIIPQEQIAFITDEPLIIELENGGLMLRYIEPTSEQGAYNLKAINSSSVLGPTIFDVKIKRAARINWVFRR